MAQIKVKLIFSTDKRQQITAALRNSLLASTIKASSKYSTGMEIILQLDEKNLKSLFLLGCEFQKVGTQTEAQPEPKKVFVCSGCGTKKKASSEEKQLFAFIVNYCEDCARQKELYNSLFLFWRRRKILYLRKPFKINKAPPEEEAVPTSVSIEEKKVAPVFPEVKIKFTKEK